MLSLRCHANKSNLRRILKLRPNCSRFFNKTNVPMNRNIGTATMAAGVGLLAGATGVVLYHYINKQNMITMERDLEQLHLSLADLRHEFEEYKISKGRTKYTHRKRDKLDVTTMSYTTEATMYSALETDLEADDEFCDVSNSDEDDLDLTFEQKSSVAMAETGEYTEIDALLEGNDMDKTKAYGLLLDMNEKTANNSEILWRLAKASHSMGTIENAKGNTKKKEQYIKQGVTYAQTALDLNPKSANVHKWFAICVGARGQFSSTKEKILDGTVFKEHIEKAIEIDPSDPTLYNLLARFEFEVSTLSSMERRVAGWLFAEVPKGTVENAIKGFEKSEELNPKPWKENRFLLAKCYIHLGKYDIAVKWLDKALELPPKTTEEKGFDEEIKKLLKKYDSYRSSS